MSPQMLAAALLFGCAACAASAVPPMPRLSRRCRDLQVYSPAAFRSPDSFFRPSLMWIWNDVLTPERLTEQLRDMADHGAFGAMPVPEPKEFRPTWMPTRLEPDYLSEGFLDRVRAAAEESRRLGARLWLYDEGGWPSGGVCGRLVREHPDLSRQVLERVEEAVAAGGLARAPANCLAAYLHVDGGDPRLLRPGQSTTATSAGRLVVYRVRTGGSYPDLLNPRATDAFLALTHDAYARAVGKEFGATIPLMFTDEPQASAMPWTDGLADDFRRQFGYDIVGRLPALFGGETDADRQARIDYHDWWSRRFAEAYLGRIQDWCHAHNLLSTGHLNGEDETLGAIKHGFGNLMRCMRRLDVPGIDVIWRQLWPGKANSDFPKHASSVAHQEGGRWAVSESFAVYGSGLTPEQMKWILDYQLVRGINLFNLVGYPYSTDDWLAGGERPHLHAMDSVWRWMPLLSDYAARVGYATSLGQSSAHTALYFPIRDIWAGGAHAERTAAAFDRIARALLECQCEYDLIDDDVLLRAGIAVEAGALRAGPMRYSTVVVPPCEWMPGGVRAVLERLASSGGRVVAVDPAAGQATPDSWQTASGAGVAQSVPHVVETDRPSRDLRVLKRDLANGSLYLLTNESVEPLRRRVRLPEESRPVLLDPLTGGAARLAATRTAAGWDVPLDLPFAGSALLLCPTSPIRAAPRPGPPGAVLQDLRDGWTLSAETAFEVTGEGLRRRERPAAGEVDAASRGAQGLGDWRKALGDALSGWAVYEVAFTCDPQTARESAWLDLGEVCYAAEVEINGRQVGSAAWQPYAVPVSGRLQPGRNVLRVRVGNTMANQYVHTRALEKWTPAQLGPYHPTALKFEPESLPSGLFGPVRLLAAGK